MIILNMTREREKAQEVVVVVEMTREMAVVEVAEEVDLIEKVLQTLPTKGHYQTNYLGRNQNLFLEIEIKWRNS